MFWNRCSEYAAELRCEKNETTDELGGMIFWGSHDPSPKGKPNRWNWHVYTAEKRNCTSSTHEITRPRLHAEGDEQHLWLAIEAANALIAALGYDAPTPNDTREPDPYRTEPKPTPADVNQELRRRKAALPKFPPNVIAEHAESLFSHPDCIGR